MSLITLPFSGMVSAGGQLVLVSKRIASPFVTRELGASFALGTNRTLQLRYFISNDDSAPTTERPMGLDLLSIFGEDSFVLGDDEQKELPFEVDQREGGSYIKVYANNTDAFEHSVDAYVVIDTYGLGDPSPLEQRAIGG